MRLRKGNEFLTKLSKFFPVVEELARVSKDPSSKIAAVAFDEEFRMLAVGYNGFPRGVVDSEERLNHRETKLRFMVHAEGNLVANAAKAGVSLKNSTVVVNLITPCSACAGLLIQAGVKRVVMLNVDANKQAAWGWEDASVMFNESGVVVDSVVA